MKRLRWQLLIVVLALAAIGVLLFSQQQTILPGIIAAPQPAVDEPAPGGIYTEGLVGSLSRLNPVLDAFNPADHDVDRLIYSSLIRFDDHGIPRGDLAETWGISEDGTAYNFSIRSNAVFHDGAPVTTEDISYTVNLIRDDIIPTPDDQREFWKQVEVRIIDDHVIQFRLPEAFAPFMDYLSFGVLPRHKLADLTPEDLINDPYNLNPVGSGPYQFDQLIVDSGQIKGVVLKAFKGYYAQPPFIEQVIFRYYPDSAAALEAYRKGEVMGVSSLAQDVLPDALKESNLKVYTGRMPRLSLIYFNLADKARPFFQDAAFRRAMLIGLNRQWMVDHILNSQAIVADGPVFPGTWAYYSGIEHLDYDSNAALAILKKAGYALEANSTDNVRSKDGIPLAFELAYPDEPIYTALAQAIQENWRQLGVKVDLKAVPAEQLLSDYLEPRTYQAALVELNLDRSPDPDPYPFWHQAQATSGQNYAGWDDRQASEYMEQARVQVDLTERAKRYRNFQVRFTNQMPALPLFYPVYSYGVDEQVQGVSMGPLFDPSDRLDGITGWFLKSKRVSGGAPAATP